MTTDFFAINGRVMPAAAATISVLDLGYLRGVGAFETLRTYGGHPHAVSEHLTRLWDSAALCGIAPCFTELDARRVMAEILQCSGHAELRVNVVVSPGEHTTGVFGSSTPTWVMIARDVHAPPEAWYRDGVTAVTFRADRPLAAHKTTSYLCGRQGIMAAEAVGAHEALYLNAHDQVTEGVTSNILALHGTVVTTPVADCLAGITKAGLRPIAERAGLSWREAPMSREQLLAADEVWITSAVREILPIVRIDAHAIASGQVGPWAARLRPLYQAACVAQSAADAHRHALAVQAAV